MVVTVIDDVRSALLGAWRLVSWTEVGLDGTVAYPFGPDPEGQLIYDASGRVSAQLTRPQQDSFASDDRRQASAAEMGAAWSSYFGYFGTFRIDAENRAVVHEIQGSWFPNLDGTDQVRRYRLDGNRLHLKADTPTGQDEIVWEKLA